MLCPKPVELEYDLTFVATLKDENLKTTWPILYIPSLLLVDDF